MFSQFPLAITFITLIIAQALSLSVSQARYKYKIAAPKVVGDPNFERFYRTHLNFLENIIVFLPLVWIGSLEFLGNNFYVVACVLWLIAKVVFSYSYIANLNFKIKIVSNGLSVLSVVVLFVLAAISIFG